MTLKELGEQYLREAAALRVRIDQLRPLLKSLDDSEALTLQNRISALYAEALDARRTGEYLIHYYEDGGQ